jgi:LuxR family transcriptional regulator, quorum-sensing system regulator BjaR1
MARRRRLGLSQREVEALSVASQGLSSKEIGEAFSIAKRTADEHLSSAISKLKARNRTHAVAIALRNKLIE